MLAELFHPGDPPLLDVRLKLVPILTPEKEALLHVELLAVMAYDKFRLDGMPDHEAREAACEVAAFTIMGTVTTLRITLIGAAGGLKRI